MNNKIEIKIIESFKHVPIDWHWMVAIPTKEYQRKPATPFAYRFIKITTTDKGLSVYLYDNKLFPEMESYDTNPMLI